jgi:hypothetical protein
VTTGNLAVNSWNQFPVTFTSDATGSATIRFTDSQTADTRNDFALDDIEVLADISHASLVFFDAASPAPIEETASSATKIATVRRLSDSRIGQSQRVYLAQDGSAAEYGDDYTSAELKFDSANNVLYVDIPVNQTSIDINILPTTDWRAESDLPATNL